MDGRRRPASRSACARAERWPKGDQTTRCPRTAGDDRSGDDRPGTIVRGRSAGDDRLGDDRPGTIVRGRSLGETIVRGRSVKRDRPRAPVTKRTARDWRYKRAIRGPARRHNRARAKTEEGRGAGNRVRTGDIQLGKLTLYQLSYARMPPQRESSRMVARVEGASTTRITSISPANRAICPTCPARSRPSGAPAENRRAGRSFSQRVVPYCSRMLGPHIR